MKTESCLKKIEGLKIIEKESVREAENRRKK